jgi:hypothetical protein
VCIYWYGSPYGQRNLAISTSVTKGLQTELGRKRPSCLV